MPHIDFSPLSALPKFKRDTYLPQLLAQWFIVFDRLAKLQYDDEPKKLLSDYHVPDIYTSNLALISEWPVCSQDLLSTNLRHQLLHHKDLGKRHNVRFCKGVVNRSKCCETNASERNCKIDVSGSVDEKAAAASVDFSKSMDKTATGASVKNVLESGTKR